MKGGSTSLKKYPKTTSVSKLLLFVIFLLPDVRFRSAPDQGLEFPFIDPYLYETEWRTMDWKDFRLNGLLLNPQGKLSLKFRNYESILYEWKPKNSLTGNAFTGLDSLVQIPAANLREFSAPAILKKISIVLTFQTSLRKEKMVLFQKTIFRSGREFGIRANLLHQNQVKLELIRFFQNQNGSYSSGEILASRKLEKKDWNQLVIVLDPVELSVSMYVDGKFAGQYKETSQDSVGMGFHPDDTTDLLVGSDFYGRIRDLRFFYGEPDLEFWNPMYDGVRYNEDAKTATHPTGAATSPVYRTRFSYSAVRNFLVEDSLLPKDTFYEIYFRSSHTSFPADSSSQVLPWIPFKKLIQLPICEMLGLEELRQDQTGANCFQYYQVRVVLRSDPSGIETPLLGKVKYNLIQTKPPAKVQSLRILPPPDSNIEELRVCLEWKGNEEPNVWKGGSYTVHYGFRKEELAGRLMFPVHEKKDRYRECIDNAAIQKHSEKYMYEKNLPFFQRGVTVYFRISAENRYYSEFGPGRDQHSELSDPVVVHFPFKS